MRWRSWNEIRQGGCGGLVSLILLCIVLISLVQMTGCGESASEYHDNQKREADTVDRFKTIEGRIDVLEMRLEVLEKNNGRLMR